MNAKHRILLVGIGLLVFFSFIACVSALAITNQFEAHISTDKTFTGEHFVINGTAPGFDHVDIISISPNGGGGTGLNPVNFSEVPGVTNDTVPVNDTFYTFSKTMNVYEDAGAGVYLILVFVPGGDGYYGQYAGINTSDKLIKHIIDDYCGGNASNLRSKTQSQILAILKDATINTAGSDNLLQGLTISVQSGTWHYVPDNYSTIQDAINAANESDTIFVYNGTYIEHLTIDKNNLTIIGEDRNTTIIDGYGYGYEGDVVIVEHCTTNCTIDGFTIKNSGVFDAGIATECSAYYINISNNILKNNYNGIFLPGGCCCVGYELCGGHNIVTQNIISDNNGDGISAPSSENITSHNEIFSNKGHGASIYSDNNTISDNNVSYNGYSNIALSGSKNNIIANNTIKYNNGGIEIASSCYYNTITNNTISSTYEGGDEIVAGHGAVSISSSNYNKVITNIFNKNYYAINLNQANYNLTRDNNILNNYRGIDIDSSNNNLLYHNNLINNTEQASDDGSNRWDNGSIEGGNYWSDHNCTGNPSNGSEPYYIEDEWPAPTPAPAAAPTAAPTPESEQYYSEGGSVDHYPFEDPNGWIQVENFIFDMGSPSNPYPSIFGTHNGTIKPNQTITVNKLYTYPCVGTGGHTEDVRIWNSSWNGVVAYWNGYIGDWHNITFDKNFTLVANEKYNYTIRTGSYPQVHHTPALPTTNGWINCTKFTDANERVYYDWIPDIKLFHEV
jgi:parallel beta-helix repeat protein